MKKRILVLLMVVALMVVMLAMAVGPAFATQGLAPNPSGNQHSDSGSFNSHNCAASETAQWRHNGSVVRNQDRQAEVQRQQEQCNHANEK